MGYVVPRAVLCDNVMPRLTLLTLVAAAEEQRRVLEFLSTRQAEEHAAKQRDKRALLESWKEQAGKRGHERKGAAEPESEGPPSPAAMRHFGGEDALAAERKRMQQLQAKQWIAQQVAEREAAQRREREEDQCVPRCVHARSAR